MFDIGWDEMALVAVVALIVIGPKDLPVVLRQVGRWTRRAREMAAEFQRGVDDMVRESELSDLKSQVEKATDPNALKRQIEQTVDPSGDIARSLEPPVLPPVTEPAANQPTVEDAEPTAPSAPVAADPAVAVRAVEQPLELPVTAPFDAPRKPPEP